MVFLYSDMSVVLFTASRFSSYLKGVPRFWVTIPLNHHLLLLLLPLYTEVFTPAGAYSSFMTACGSLFYSRWMAVRAASLNSTSPPGDKGED